MGAGDSYLYQEIAETLRRRIASGDLKPGDRLPPVRDMARRWNCTPGTVSRAYARLARQGLATGHRGGGTRVAAGPLQPEHPAWRWANLVNRAERFVLAAIGGGHTPAQAEAALSVAIARWQALQQQQRPQSQKPAIPTTTLRFAGSHDLTVELAARLLADTAPHTQLEVAYVGSLGGLMALARNEADVAGLHLWDEATNTYNLPFIKRVLPGQRVATITLAHRSLGLIVPPGNPHNLRGPADLARPGLQLANRQAGSGTRVWLDAQLKALNISAADIAGYNCELLTHLAVARAVEQGEATVGVGIHAAAAAFGLAFVPLTRERYDLAFLAQGRDSPAAQSLAAVIRSARFKEAVAALGGYDTSHTGEEQWIF